jgi:hypothetical protein
MGEVVAWFSWPERCTGWAGWNEKEEVNSPVHRLGIFGNKLRARGSFTV